MSNISTDANTQIKKALIARMVEKGYTRQDLAAKMMKDPNTVYHQLSMERASNYTIELLAEYGRYLDFEVGLITPEMLTALSSSEMQFLRERVEDLTRQVEILEQEKQAKNELIAERRDHIVHLDQQITERDNTIKELTAQLAKKDETIERKDKKMSELLDRVFALGDKLAGK